MDQLQNDFQHNLNDLRNLLDRLSNLQISNISINTAQQFRNELSYLSSNLLDILDDVSRQPSSPSYRQLPSLSYQQPPSPYYQQPLSTYQQPPSPYYQQPLSYQQQQQPSLLPQLIQTALPYLLQRIQ